MGLYFLILFFSSFSSLLAIAAGMMLAASYSLLYEGCNFDDPHDTSTIPIEYRTAIGAVVGLVFIVVPALCSQEAAASDLTQSGA